MKTTAVHTRWRFVWLGGLTAILMLVTAGCSGTALTPTASPTPSPTAATQIIIDNPLTLDTSDLPQDAVCHGRLDGYHVTGDTFCTYGFGELGDLQMAVTVKLLTGDLATPYGLVFRRASEGNAYVFGIDGSGQWAFEKLVNDTFVFITQPASNSVINSGFNAANTLQVQAHGTHFIFSINSVQVGEADDTTFDSGEYGLWGEAGLDVVFTNLTVATFG